MRQFKLAMWMTAAIVVSGCSGDTSPSRSATKVLKPEEAKISLGSGPVAEPSVNDQTP